MEISKAKIKMKKSLLLNSVVDEKTYYCDIMKYDKEEESIYLILKEENLMNISLDSIYECVIYRGNVGLKCEGRIEERYVSQDKQIVCLRLEKGFYKINIKYVDKAETE
ncbi:hypothetical protein [Faecalimonas sp.]